MSQKPIFIGRLQRQNIRDVWPKEDADFTKWLAMQENLELLADTLGLGSLDEVKNEVSVGSFRADVVCEDPNGQKVVIENQFATSDHKHLGQIITYLAGIDAIIVVWIAERIREEHRAAIDWLNEATSLDHSFFGVEIEVWRIGNSDAAPRFEVVVQPNEWKRRQIQRSHQIEMVDYQRRMEYWGLFLATVFLNPPERPISGEICTARLRL